ncbi:hypothetical protein SAMN05421847_2648 [Halpernia humi]|uniref:Lipoprotein n=1 Tax=Halpernia humi TaxID=493375 RepID=A0A1H6B1T8_9FLAO|nr:hypothetical protein [Halpernia humi]SEG54580.1 hypothetical protein SAMN05421847_2648 [Halpernia humi]
MRRLLLILIGSILFTSCTDKKTEQNIELNRIMNGVLKYESKRKKLDSNYKFLVSSELDKLKIYIPSQKEILGEEPGPPPFFNRNIIRLLDLNKDNSENRKSDSLNLLIQNNYVFDSIQLEKSINKNIIVANKNEIDKRKNLYIFSNPVFYNDKFTYIETNFYDSSFGIGFGYILEKQKNGNWKVIKIENTFIT